VFVSFPAYHPGAAAPEPSSPERFGRDDLSRQECERSAVGRVREGVIMRAHTARARVRANDGFTLIELLVAMATGLLICATAFLVLEASMRQAARVSDRVSANQRGRVALEKIMAELHSSCLASNATPIGAGSEGSKLVLVSETGGQTSFDVVHLHEITLTAGTLTDTSYASTGTKPGPEWEFSKTGTKTVLLTGVSASAATPVFHYFGYGAGSELQTTPLATPLSKAGSSEASAVTVTFNAAPESDNLSGDRASSLTDTAVLRFAPTSGSSVNALCA
jgi:type II secretory pathway pseudopilin PulG